MQRMRHSDVFLDRERVARSSRSHAPEPEVVNGHVYVFGTESGNFTVKRASVTEDRITLMPDSYLPGYESIEFTRSGERPLPRVIGRVVWFTMPERFRV